MHESMLYKHDKSIQMSKLLMVYITDSIYYKHL